MDNPLDNLPDDIKARLSKQFAKAGILTDLQAVGLMPSELETELAAFITADADMIRMKQDIMKIWNRPEPVIIYGESGTGKETIARALHGNRRGSMISINMTALPDYLLESELYGHIKGAFTGAIVDKQGLLEAAQDGTLFLDEIGDMPLLAQTKLLRAIQERVVRPVGSVVEHPINCRIVAATHRNLEDMLGKGLFRLDLYYRLTSFVLRTKPLRNRIEDIRKIIVEKLDKDRILPDSVVDSLVNNGPYYGNVRELEQRVLRYQVLGEI